MRPQLKLVPTLFAALQLSAIAVPQARADGFTLGDAANFAVLYEGMGGHQLNYNNSNVTGNIGIGLTGKFAGNGPGTITGTVEFSATNTGQFSNSGLTITGGAATYNNANVQTDLNALNVLSQNLGSESGTSLAISDGGSVNASAGTLDASGNRVFTVSSVSFTNAHTFTINGASTDYVVFNVGFSAAFNGTIVLAGGITSDHVLFNFTAGDYSTLSGGSTLTISTNGASTVGTFLDPNGDFQINHSVLDGRIFGGGTHDSAIVSGANIVAPPTSIPEPTTITMLGAGLILTATAFRRRHKGI